MDKNEILFRCVAVALLVSSLRCVIITDDE